MATLYIGKGKKDKVSKGDIVGFLCKKGGLKATEIGRIDVMQRYAYAAVAKSKLATVLKMSSGGNQVKRVTKCKLCWGATRPVPMSQLTV